MGKQTLYSVFEDIYLEYVMGKQTLYSVFEDIFENIITLLGMVW
jgi:hypothetical protein